MPILSLYEFERERPERAGPFRETHLPFKEGACLELGGGEGQSLLLRVREEAEEVLDLFAVFNAPASLTAVEELLGPRVQRVGPVRVSYVSWGRSELRVVAPGRHHEEELLATVNVEFHVPLPGRLDADGTLAYYLAFWLDTQGGLHGEVDGGAFHFRGGLPQGSGAVARALERCMREGLSPVARLLQDGLRGFARGRRFRRVDLLPGRGGRKGRRRWGNADRQIALAAVPEDSAMRARSESRRAAPRPPKAG